jgi:Fe-S-cluster containining protein
MAKDRRWKLFECQRCGICCTGELPYDPESIFKIADFLGLTLEKTIETYYGRLTDDGKGWESEEHKRMPCPFLANESDGKKTCRIYSVRPLGCKLYPFDSTGSLDCPVARTVFAKMREEED